MSSIFDQSVRSVLKEEGGYVHDPSDPGGETKFGISKRAYPALDIACLSVGDAIAIYRADFWDRIHGDELPASLAYFLMDTAVNLGVVQAVRYLQRAAGVPVDGVVGPVTLVACRNPGVLERLRKLREEHYRCLRTFGRYGTGWLRRTAEVYAQAKAFER